MENNRPVSETIELLLDITSDAVTTIATVKAMEFFAKNDNAVIEKAIDNALSIMKDAVKLLESNPALMKKNFGNGVSINYEDGAILLNGVNVLDDEKQLKLLCALYVDATAKAFLEAIEDKKNEDTVKEAVSISLNRLLFLTFKKILLIYMGELLQDGELDNLVFKIIQNKAEQNEEDKKRNN